MGTSRVEVKECFILASVSSWLTIDLKHNEKVVSLKFDVELFKVTISKPLITDVQALKKKVLASSD